MWYWSVSCAGFVGFFLGFGCFPFLCNFDTELLSVLVVASVLLVLVRTVCIVSVVVVGFCLPGPSC